PAERRTRGLEPVDADGLLIAGFVLEANLDEIAGLEHLARGLGKPRFVPVHGRKCRKPWNEENKANQNEKKIPRKRGTRSGTNRSGPRQARSGNGSLHFASCFLLLMRAE